MDANRRPNRKRTNLMKTLARGGKLPEPPRFDEELYRPSGCVSCRDGTHSWVNAEHDPLAPDPDGQYCAMESRPHHLHGGTWLCTRTEGHTGFHAAHDPDGNLLAFWSGAPPLRGSDR